MDKLKELLLDPSERERGTMNSVYYALRRNGGFWWPTFYAPLYFFARPHLEVHWQVVFSVALVVGILIHVSCMVFGDLYIRGIKKNLDAAYADSFSSFSKMVSAGNDAGIIKKIPKEVEDAHSALIKLKETIDAST